MVKRWFQYKEVMAGQKRLFLTYYLYKIFGKKILKLISFFAAFGAFISSKDRRKASFEFYKTLQNYTGKKFSPVKSAFKQFINFGDSLADKMISFLGDIDPNQFEFKEYNQDEIFSLIKENKGIFFLTTHIGNAEILRSMLDSKENITPNKVNIFLEKKVCSVFNSFLDSIKKENRVETFALEDIGADTAIILDEKLNKGELVFMAGDRLSKTNADKFYTVDFLNKRIKLPQGAIRLSVALRAPIFFVVCAKEKERFNIHIQRYEYSYNKKENIEKLKYEYSKFLEKYAIRYPYQFFHFYNIFE